MEPRCPHCNAQGVQHIAAKPLPSAVVLYCGQCGAIFGVVPNQPEPKRGLLKNPANIANPGDASAPPNPAMLAVDERPLTPEQSQAMMNYYKQFNRGTNRTRIEQDGEE